VGHREPAPATMVNLAGALLPALETVILVWYTPARA
jgi:hypothetical protein